MSYKVKSGKIKSTVLIKQYQSKQNNDIKDPLLDKKNIII